MADSNATALQPAMQPPPRRTGNLEADFEAMYLWMHRLFEIGVVQTGLLDPSQQSDAGEFDPENLPDPANTTIAKSQLTANEAYAKAKSASDGVMEAKEQAAQAAKAALPIFSDSFTMPADKNQAVINFTDELPDTDYIPMVMPTGFTGTPDPDGFAVTKIAKATDKITIDTAVIPGTGATITFQVTLFPPPPDE
jgi:hypothetical protein